jgi:uncharacterized protein (TIGR02996 family)
MSEYDALIRAILLHPDEDAPRLILADWLDEHNATVKCRFCGGLGGELDGYGKNAWVPCGHCDRGEVSNGNSNRATFIRSQINKVGPEPGWAVRYFAGTLVPELGTLAQYVRFDDFDRGFLCNIELPTAVFLGEPCIGCNGDGWYEAPHTTNWTPCPSCGGIDRPNYSKGGLGYPLDFARKLFASHPITRIRLSGMLPIEFDGKFHFMKLRHEPENPWFVPGLIYNCIENPRSQTPLAGVQLKEFPSKKEARAALDRAVLKFGRQLAGLG